MSNPVDNDDVPLEPLGADPVLVGATFFGPSASAVSVAQEETRWCWAASAQMLRRSVSVAEKEQCAIAAQRLSMPCCSERAACNVALPLDQIEPLLNENLMTSVRERAQLSSERFWGELFANRPVLLVDIFGGGNDAHARVVFGWQKLPRGTLVARVADPAKAKKSSVLFEALQSSEWRETWYRIEAS
jgi:hypothetical protein